MKKVVLAELLADADQAEQYDVIVVGYGFAGGAAAIAAADAGSRVLLIEKMKTPGGISIVSGGGIRLAKDRDAAARYIYESCGHRTPKPVVDMIADGMTKLEDYWRGLARVNGAELVFRDREGNYPFPGFETFYYLDVERIPGFEPKVDYPHVRGRLGGPFVFKVVDDNVRLRSKIDVRLATPVTSLLADENGRICGVSAETDGEETRFLASKGVILASGGYEASREIQKKYWQIDPIFSAANRGNTGDGLLMAQAAGADLWHMWHYHGSYGFRHPDENFPYALRVKRLPDWTKGGKPMEVQMAWVLLDQQGRRFMNECPPYVQDTGHRPFDSYDPTSMTFPRIPAFLIFDEHGRQMYPMGQSVMNDPDYTPYEWSQDNLQEVENGILKKADSIEELAGIIGAPVETVRASLERWNALCDAGDDADFQRPPGTMAKVGQPPFYVGTVWPVVNNTQGGPVHDERQRVLNPFGEQIDRLFVAGELGSIWGFLYLAGGNLSECFITGDIAGKEVSALEKLF